MLGPYMHKKRKKVRKSNNEKGGDKQKKSKTHNRQCKKDHFQFVSV